MKHLHVASIAAAAAALTCPAAPKMTAETRLHSIPIYFEPNQGQFDPQVRFLARGAKYQAWITDSKLVLQLNNKTAPVVIQFGPSTSKPKPEGLERQVGTSSYFYGNDESKWVTGVPSFARAKLADVYPGIDVVFYAHDKTREIEYDFVVKPGADPSQISIDFDPKMKPQAGPLGEITLQTPAGELRHRIPSVHQGNKQIEFQTAFDGVRQKFHFGDYDARQSLIVDPGVVYSGIFTAEGDVPSDVAADPQGNSYFVGTTITATFPASNFADTPPGPSNGKIFVVKIGATPVQGVYPRLYSAYLGGNGNFAGASIAVDSTGAAYIAGSTQSRDFPTRNAFQPTNAGFIDGFIVKLSATAGQSGHTIVYSSYVGGSNVDYNYGVAVDATGAAYLLGETDDNQTFPSLNATAPTVPNVNTGQRDAFVVKVAGTPASNGVYNRVYSMVFGGSRGESVRGGIAVDATGAAYIGGSTNSSDFPVVRAAQPTKRGDAFSHDGFIAKIGAAPVSGLYQFEYSTFLGGTANDFIEDITVDAGGFAYVVGTTESMDLPVVLGLQQTRNGLKDAFVALIGNAPTGTPAVHPLLFSTYFGGSGQTSGNEIAGGAQGAIYIAGSTELRPSATNIPLLDPAFLVTTPGIHAFVSKISVGTTASRLEYSTLLGRSGSAPTGLALDATGSVHVSGETFFPLDFPTIAAPPPPNVAEQFQLFGFGLKLSGAVSGNTVGIGASSNGRKFTVTGVPACAPGDYIAPQFFAWPAGTACTVTFVDSETTQGGAYRYDFKAWSDGSTNRMRTITAGALSQTLSANYDEFVRLTTSVIPQLGAPINSGTVTPSGNTYQLKDSVVTILATPSQGWYFKSWQAETLGRITGVTVSVTMNRPQTVVAEFGVFSETRTGLQFVPVQPCRILDTRLAPDVLAQPQVALRVRDVVPSSANCNIPAGALAFSLNATVVPKGPLGYITLWPKGAAQPTVSTLNSLDGRIKANAAVVPAGTNGAISIFATDPTDVVLDINGYFIAPNALGSSYYPVTPCRIIDTRTPNGSPRLAAKGTRTISIQAANCGIPANARAYALNATVVPTRTLGYLNLWPTGTSQPLSSTLNALTGTVVANSAIVRAGTGGSIDAYATDDTELILDITGYFGAPGAPGALTFYPVTPCRLTDTRTGANIPLPAGNVSSVFTLTGIAGCPVPEWAKSLSVNSTVVPQPTLGYLTLYPLDTQRPLASTLNAIDGAITSNAGFAELSLGKLLAFATERTHFILDMSGYFAQ